MRRMRVSRPGPVIVALMIWSAGCGNTAVDPVTGVGAAPAPTRTTTAPEATESPATSSPRFECPVTRPPVPGLAVPEPYPDQPSQGVWYGTEELWTVLEPDGTYFPRKGVFWSAKFGGGTVEEQPGLGVTWRRLDEVSPLLSAGPPGTNAYTPEDGWFMMAGIDPDDRGCWEVTATYRGATLSYVYLRPEDA